MAQRMSSSSRSRFFNTRPVQEDFKPVSEWKHDDGFDTLLLDLPSFTKEQIRIIAERGQGTLKVRGERFLDGDNRKSYRFQEEVHVPKDCDIEKIRAKFEKGVLWITMPKIKSSSSPQSRPNPINVEPYTQRDPSKPPSNMVSEQPQQLPSKPSAADEAARPLDNYELNNKNDHEECMAKLPASTQTDGIRQNDIVEGKATAITTTTNTKQKALDKNTSNWNWKNRGQEDEEKIKGGGGGEGRNMDSYNLGAGVDRYAEGLCHTANTNLQQQDGAAEHMKEVKSSLNYWRRRLKEDRQLVVNAGVAVLVMVALGAHISFPFLTSSTRSPEC